MMEEEAKLKAKRDRINAKLRQIKGRQQRDSRKTETRCKILAGAFLLEQAERNPEVKAWMLKGFTWFLTRPEERALFDLPSPASERPAVESADHPDPVREPGRPEQEPAHATSH